MLSGQQEERLSIRQHLPQIGQIGIAIVQWVPKSCDNHVSVELKPTQRAPAKEATMMHEALMHRPRMGRGWALPQRWQGYVRAYVQIRGSAALSILKTKSRAKDHAKL